MSDGYMDDIQDVDSGVDDVESLKIYEAKCIRLKGLFHVCICVVFFLGLVSGFLLLSHWRVNQNNTWVSGQRIVRLYDADGKLLYEDMDDAKYDYEAPCFDEHVSYHGFEIGEKYTVEVSLVDESSDVVGKSEVSFVTKKSDGKIRLRVNMM